MAEVVAIMTGAVTIDAADHDRAVIVDESAAAAAGVTHHADDATT
jgi:hypothetical protein